MWKAVLLVGMICGLIFCSYNSVPVYAGQDLEQRVKALEEKASTDVSKIFEGLKISGFVDTSYVYDDNAESNTFSLDQIELDIEKTISDTASLRTDLNFVNGDEEDGLTVDEIMEQGYVTFGCPILNGTEFTFGKFNAPIGFELLDAPDMYQFSHALVFDYGLPTNLTGLMGAFGLGEVIDISLYIVNGWDVISDNNKEKTYGGRIGFTPSESLNFGISGIYGAEKDNDNSDKRSVIDIDATMTPTDALTIGAEVNFGGEEDSSVKTMGDDAEWFGCLLMAHYDMSDRMGLTLRYDYFDDKDGYAFGLVSGGDDAGKQVKMQSVTIAPTFVIADGAGFLIEYRYDFADEDFFEDADGKYTDNNHTVAFEFTYSF